MGAAVLGAAVVGAASVLLVLRVLQCCKRCWCENEFFENELQLGNPNEIGIKVGPPMLVKPRFGLSKFPSKSVRNFQSLSLIHI